MSFCMWIDAQGLSDRGVRHNPKGIESCSPGLRACELPWETDSKTYNNPEGVASSVRLNTFTTDGTTPLGSIRVLSGRFPRVAAGAPTLGWRTKSLRDFALDRSKI